MLEVLDGGALAQEFRIGDDLHLRVGTFLAQDAFDLVAGADRHGRFGDHDRRARQQRRDLAHRLKDEAQIGMTVAAARRRTDGDHHRIGLGDAGRLGGEFEPALPDVGFHKLGEAGLEDRNLAAIERRDPRRLLVDAGDMMAEIGEAGPGNETDIAGADHGYAHECLRSLLEFYPWSVCLRIGPAGGAVVPSNASTEAAGAWSARPQQRKPSASEQREHERSVNHAANQRQHEQFRFVAEPRQRR